MAAENASIPSSPIHRGLLHGRMNARDKEDVMTRFREGEIDVLVCTTVIEVGIDVPRATMIVVENAERFGLSQLHQLRGRVGRGTDPSRCILLASTKRTNLATRRLRIMEKTSDGFLIAEEDLKIRGVGDMLGVRQSGMPAFRIGDIVRDLDIMIEATEDGRGVDGPCFRGRDGRAHEAHRRQVRGREGPFGDRLTPQGERA
jgi:ATP-dependent DNA helicase RecG